MKPTFISKEKNEAKFSMEFTGEEFEGAIINVYRANKGKFLIDGFRKGKAPRGLIETRYGDDVFFEDAINEMFSQNYPNALDELSLEVIDRPAVEFSELKKGEGFTVTITVDVYPEFEVKDYRGVVIEKVDDSVPEGELDGELESLRKRNARMVVAEKPAEEGNTVILDYEGFVDGLPFDGGTAERQPLKLGTGSFIPGFEEQLVGVLAGEERDVKLMFPEEYHAEDLAGKDAVFKCRIHEVKEEELPELNDDFAKDVSEHDTLDELKAEISDRLEKSAKARAENRMKNAAIEMVYNANDIDVPAPMVEDEFEAMLGEFDQQLRYQGMSLEKYYEYTEKDSAALRDEFKGEAERKVKTRMLALQVAEQEGLAASEEDVEGEMKLIAESYKMEVDKLREMLGDERVSIIEKDIRMRKAIDFIFENAEVM